MDKFIDNKWLLRITALSLAVLMFFSVRPNGTNNVDSTTSGMRDAIIQDVPVEIRYDDSNFVVSGVPQTVDVKIHGPIGIVITTQTGRNFKVIANIKDKPSGEHVIKYKAVGFSDKLDVEVDPKTAKVMVEERITKDVRVEPEINENQLADHKFVKSMTTEPQTVTVSGAKSAIESISYVKATVSAEKGTDKTFEKSAGVKIFDRDLNILNVDVEPKTVTVKVELGEYNREVPVIIKAKGTPAKGYAVESVTSKTKKVVIYGSRAEIDQIHQITVDADVSDLKKSKTVNGTIHKPKGVTSTSIDRIDIKVNITKDNENNSDDVANSEDSTKKEDEETTTSDEKTLQNINVRLAGLDVAAFNHAFVTPTTGQIDVVAKGEGAAKLTKGDVSVSVDASKVAEGTEELPVQVDGPGNIEFRPSMTNVQVHFTKKAS